MRYLKRKNDKASRNRDIENHRTDTDLDVENNQKVSYVVFFCTLVVVLLTLTPVIFPALFSSYFGMFTENLNPFELGYQSIFLFKYRIVELKF